MRIDSAKSTLKVLGIIAIIFGVLGIIAGFGLIAGIEMVGKDMFTSSGMRMLKRSHEIRFQSLLVT